MQKKKYHVLSRSTQQQGTSKVGEFSGGQLLRKLLEHEGTHVLGRYHGSQPRVIFNQVPRPIKRELRLILIIKILMAFLPQLRL